MDFWLIPMRQILLMYVTLAILANFREHRCSHSKRGEPTLLIGPESEAFALDRSKIARVRKMMEYRESAEPEYPELRWQRFQR